MPTGGGYARVYYSILDDPKFESIYEDDHHFALWIRLLLAHEMAWPSSVPIPADARPSSVRALVAVALISLRPHRHYVITGMQAERERRSAAGRIGAAVRWHSDGNGLAERRIARPSPSPSPSSFNNPLPPTGEAGDSRDVANRRFDKGVDATQRELRRIYGEPRE
jgi:hypothetical protein